MSQITPPLVELQNLRFFKEDAIERMEENERVIASQKERIKELEFHLGKSRDMAYQICYATVGVLPMNYADATPAKKSKKLKAKL